MEQDTLDLEVEAEELPEYDRDLLLELWSKHLSENGYARFSRNSFIAVVARSFTDGEDLEIVWCESCEEPGADGEDDYSGVKSGGYACQPCLESDYFWCNSCSEYDTTSDSQYVDDDYVCEGCYDRYYSYCDECDESYHNDYSEDHDHDNDCDCEAPGQSFLMRNDGEDPLANDTRVTISLPAGEIDTEGISKIARLLIRHDLYIVSDIVQAETIGTAWQTGKGNYTKRLSREAYKVTGKGLSPEIMSEIGTIARDHSKPVNFAIEVTRDLNQSAEDFYHEDSCWWSSHSESRCTLKTNGGIGLRTFVTTETNYGGYDSVSGRAWIMPLKVADGVGSFEPGVNPPAGALTPTTDTANPAAFVVFNGYGDLSGYTPARILAHMAGMTYRKIAFDADPMYVNSTAGYLIAPEEIATSYTDGSLYLSLDQHASLHDRERMTSNVA